MTTDMDVSRRPEYTATQFEADYSAGSRMAVKDLRRLGFIAAPCQCDYDKCRGWQMRRIGR